MKNIILCSESFSHLLSISMQVFFYFQCHWNYFNDIFNVMADCLNFLLEAVTMDKQLLKNLTKSQIIINFRVRKRAQFKHQQQLCNLYKLQFEIPQKLNFSCLEITQPAAAKVSLKVLSRILAAYCLTVWKWKLQLTSLEWA